jgi:hypothetical protein
MSKFLTAVAAILCFSLSPAPAHAIVRNVFANGLLARGLDMGIDTSEMQRDWLKVPNGGPLQMSYPPGQEWGACFITVGKPTPAPRPSINLSFYSTLVIVMRGVVGGEQVEVGVKDSLDLDNGTETKTLVELSTEWETYEFPLAAFSSADLRALYVVTEFVFDGPASTSIEVQSIEYRAPTNLSFSGMLTGTDRLRSRGRKSSTPTTVAISFGGDSWTLTDGAGTTLSGTFTSKKNGRRLVLTLDSGSDAILRARLEEILTKALSAKVAGRARGSLKLSADRSQATLQLVVPLVGVGGRYVLKATGAVGAGN